MVSESHREYFEKGFSPGFFYGGRHKKVLKDFFEKSPPPDTLSERPRTLDIGFGSIDELIFLYSIYPSSLIVGIDIYTKKMKSLSRQVRETNNISVVNGDINTLDFDDNYFDHIYLFNSICFAEDTAAIISQLHNMLVKRGSLVISCDFHDDSESKIRQKYLDNNISFNEPRLDELRSAFETAKFKEISEYKSPVNGEIFFTCRKK